MRELVSTRWVIDTQPNDRTIDRVTTTLEPLYMWAGGKSRLLEHYRPIWPVLGSRPYVEPFFGGGAVFCWLANTNAGLSASIGDINCELIGLLAEIRDRPEPLIRRLGRLTSTYLALETKSDRKAWYYSKRSEYWEAPNPSLLLTLMRLSFNGIWQTCVDSKGTFGTPAGLLNHKTKDQIFNPSQIRAWSTALKDTQVSCGTYETQPIPKTPSLIYLDPPYRGSYTTYGRPFGDIEQELLVAWYRERVSEGHQVILANRSLGEDRFFEDLLGDTADFYYFDVKYTAGRRARTADGYEAMSAREFVAISR
jgi:DNA adenine methylase